MHRFLGHRIPEHRVTLYEKCTDALLYEWDRSKFGHAVLVGELDAPARRMLLSGLARKMHERGQAEVSEVEVVAHFEQALPHLGSKASDAKQIVEEIRDRSGVLVERRSGFFAFSHLVFQEYLTALAFTPQNYKELVNHYEDPWWHEVIVLAAGTPGANAGRLANALLEKNESAATLLAAQCLETAVQMSLEVREKIEQQLTKLIPPKTELNARQLADLNAVAAPVLTRALGGKLNAAEAQGTLFALTLIDYEPAISAIAKFVTDADSSASLRDMQAYAMLVLARKALLSRLAKATFIALVPKLSLEVMIPLALRLKEFIEASYIENREREIAQELLDTLPPEIKKD